MKLRRNKRNDEVERIDKLCDEVRSAAYQSVECLWSAFLGSWIWCGPPRRPCAL